ncbi:MAG: hypothetical protein ABIA67_04210 [Candidatus Margulisiibacteriota bacterium]
MYSKSRKMKQKFTRKLKPKSIRYALHGAHDAIGTLEHGCELFLFTKGQLLLVNILACILDQTGPADLDIITWAIGNETIDKLAALRSSGKIKSMRLIIDYSVQSMHPEYCRKIRRVFGDESIRVTKNHAKVLVLRNAEWNLVVRSSMNLNVNRRLEYCEISDDREMAAFFGEFFGEWWRTRATGVSFEYSGKFHGDELKKFGVDNDNELGFDVENIDINF